MTIPPTLTLRTLADMARRPAWWFNLLTTQPLEFASVTHWNGTVADLVGRMFDPGATLNDLHWLRAEWPRALIVKASSAPTTPAPSSTSARTPSSSRTTEAASLTELSPPSTCFPVSRPPSETAPRSSWTAVSPSEQTSSPQSGLGATAVLAGRAYLYGLMAGGERGVVQALTILHNEAIRTLHLLGVPDIDTLGNEHVRSGLSGSCPAEDAVGLLSKNSAESSFTRRRKLG